VHEYGLNFWIEFNPSKLWIREISAHLGDHSRMRHSFGEVLKLTASFWAIMRITLVTHCRILFAGYFLDGRHLLRPIPVCNIVVGSYSATQVLGTPAHIRQIVCGGGGIKVLAKGRLRTVDD